MRAAFASDVGVDEAPLNTKDGGFVWFMITKIDPAHELTFEEAKPEVEKEQRAEEVDKALAGKADDLVKQLSSGASVADVAKSAGFAAKSAADIHRDEQSSLPEAVVAAIFRQPAEGAGSAATPDGRIVFKVTGDRTPPVEFVDPRVKEMASRLDASTRESLLDQYVAALRRSLGVVGPSGRLAVRRGRLRAMTTLPDYDAFARAYVAGEAEVAVTTLVADLETPVSAYLKLARGRRGNMFLLESVEGGAQRGRYSMIGLDPDLIFRSTGDQAEINRRALADPDAFTPLPGDPLQVLRSLLAELRIAMPPGLPPMSAGVFGYLGYDMVRRMERLPPAKRDPIGVPEALLIRPTIMVVFDGARDEMAIVTPVRPAPGVSARAAYESAMARLDAVVDALESPLDHAAGVARRSARQGRRSGLEHHRGRIQGDGRQGEGLYRRGRRVPDRAVAALHQPLRFARLLALSRAEARQSLPLPMLPRLRRLSDCRLQPGNPGSRARRQGRHPADRRHPSARGVSERGRSARGRTARRPEGARRAPDAARSRPQRRRTRSQDRHGQGHRQLLHRAL